MANYSLGILFGLIGGMGNFLGQVLQKKAINETPINQRNKELMKTLIRNKTWIAGLVCQIALSAVFLMLAQSMIGGVLIPGLLASGLIVLAIGSSKILKENLKVIEIIAIILLIIGITLIGFSELAIQSSTTYFLDANFNFRITIFSIFFTIAWLGLYYLGKRVKRYNSLFLALGTGFPFVIGNIWLQPLIAAMILVLNGTANIMEWTLFSITVVISILVNLFGITHYQHALNSGKASLVVPIQQIPQQIAPIFIYYFIYQFQSPKTYSLLLILLGIMLICIAGFVLGQRQASLEKIKAETK